MEWNAIGPQREFVLLAIGVLSVFGAITLLVVLTGVGPEGLDASGFCAGPDL